jgi:hypothetical protein
MAKRKKAASKTSSRTSARGRAKLKGGAVRDLELLGGKARPVRGGALSPTSPMGRMSPVMGRIQPSGLSSEFPKKRI